MVPMAWEVIRPGPPEKMQKMGQKWVKILRKSYETSRELPEEL